MSFNQVIMLGNLTRDPQLSYLPNQTPVVEFGIATNRKWTGQDGQAREEVCFVDCTAFGRIAENINKYFNKGKPILIVGRLIFDRWETPEGVKRSKHKINVERFTFVGGGEGEARTDNQEPISEPTQESPPPDDIPF